MAKDRIYEFKRAFFGKVRKMLLECDIAIEVADARNIQGTRVRKLDRPFASKVLIAAAKSDIAQGPFPPSVDHMSVIPFSSRTNSGKERILAALQKRRSQINERRIRAGKQPLPEIRICVFGIPNVGKSSLINALSGKHAARTGFKAGVTKSVQWITIGKGLLLYDTPGIVNLEESEEQLALKSSLDVEKLADPEDAALSLISRILSSKSDSLFKLYSIPHSSNPEQILESMAKRRGLLLKGGEPNMREAAKVLIREYQKGRF